MTDWQYFMTTSSDRGDDSVPRSLGRTDRSGRRHNAQTLNGAGGWVNSEFLERYHLLGTTDVAYILIPEERAAEVVKTWVSAGRLAHAPAEPRQ